MNVYQSTSGLLICIARKKNRNVKIILNKEDILSYLPKGIPGLNRTLPCLYFRGDLTSKDIPTWKGDIYVEGSYKGKAERIKPSVRDCLPLLYECREIFSPKAYDYLTERHSRYPDISEWELLGVANWLESNPIEGKLSIEVIHNILGAPERESKYAQYVKVIGTDKGAKVIFKMKESELWPFIMGGYLSNYLERHKPELYYLLAEARNSIDMGLPVKEVALLLNGYLSEHTKSA